ncbi:MAG: hypothetical protein DRP42_05105, partial [Tenericutes bacterium]
LPKLPKLPKLREWQTAGRGRGQREGYRVGDVVVVVRTNGHPFGHGKKTPSKPQEWHLARVVATEPIPFGHEVIRVSTGERLARAHHAGRLDGRVKWHTLTITRLGDRMLRQRDAWEAYRREDSPVWTTPEETMEWVRRHMVVRA